MKYLERGKKGKLSIKVDRLADALESAAKDGMCPDCMKMWDAEIPYPPSGYLFIHCDGVKP